MYPHQLLKPGAGSHGPQSNSIHSEARSNINHTCEASSSHENTSLCPHKTRIFCQTFSSHGVCLSFTTKAQRCVKGMVLYERAEKNSSFASQCLIRT